MPHIGSTRIIQTQGTLVVHISSHLPIFRYIFLNKCHSHLKIHLFLSVHIKPDITFYDSFPKNSRIMKCSKVLNSFLAVGFFPVSNPGIGSSLLWALCQDDLPPAFFLDLSLLLISSQKSVKSTLFLFRIKLSSLSPNNLYQLMVPKLLYLEAPLK